MERKTNQVYLLHIRDAVDLILSWSVGKNIDDFKTDIKLQSAIVRQIEIIGEAVRNISSELKINFPDIPWRPISDTRNRLMHEYFSVDLEKVWRIVTQDIPNLKKQILKILQTL